jgi:hypothetical protein
LDETTFYMTLKIMKLTHFRFGSTVIGFLLGFGLAE